MDYQSSLINGFLLSMSCCIIVVVAEQCITPLGKSSECIHLYDCPQLLELMEKHRLSSDVVTFLQKSHCGFEDDIPKVCCGSLPEGNNPSIVTRLSQVTTEFSNEIDLTSEEDSSPAPMDKCGFDTEGGIGDKILGGRSTYLDEFPWMALLGYRKESGKILYKCGGALINHRYVLTAAHCISGAIETIIGKLITVRLGEYDMQTDHDCVDDLCADPVQEIHVHAAFPHPGYREIHKNRRDDIGLIRLSRRVKYSDYIRPICLADSKTKIDEDNEVYVAGWGQTLNGRSSSVKQKLSFSIFNKTKCNEKYETKGADLTDKQVCAGGEFGEGACRGDSGGPIMRRKSDDNWEAISIVSFGYGCGRKGWPGVSTSVAGYNDWIRSMLTSTNV